MLMRCCSILVSLTFLSCTPTPILQGEKVINRTNIQLFHKFAPIIPAGDGSALIFRINSQDGHYEIGHLWPNLEPKEMVQPIDGFSLPYSYREGRQETKYDAKYGSVKSSQGVWLVGATIEFISNSNQHLSGTLRFPRESPSAVALPDGSILVAGGIPWTKIIGNYNDKLPEMRSVERVTVTNDGRITSQYVAPLPDCVNPNCNGFSPQNFSMTALKDGRILFAGGYYNKSTYIYDSITNHWKVGAPLSQPRIDFSLSLLPDGRVLAAGGNEDYQDLQHKNMTTEIWSPKTEQWSAGPPLPVQMIKHTAILIDNKTIVLAGGRFAGVLSWDIDTPQWDVAATLALARAEAGVVSLGNRRIAIIGGLNSNSYKDAYGKPTLGYSLVDIPLSNSKFGPPSGNSAIGQAFASSASKVFVAGGKITSFFEGGVNNDPTASVEIYDYKTNISRTLSTLPFGTKSAKAIWLDDHRVLTMALQDGDLNPMWFGIFDTISGEKTTLPIPKLGYYIVPTLGRSNPSLNEYEDGKRIGTRDERYYEDLQLISARDNHVLISGQMAGLHLLDITNNTAITIDAPRRNKGITRLLKNGKIVMAGGYEPFDMVLSRLEDCETCPEQYVESAKNTPLTTYDTFDPVLNTWKKSVPSSAFAGPAAILDDGRVAKLGGQIIVNSSDAQNPTIEKLLLSLELSNTTGTAWQKIDLPLTEISISDSGDIRLLTATNLEGELGGLLILGLPSSKNDLIWWWMDVNSTNKEWHSLRLSQKIIPDWQFKNDVYFGSIKMLGRDVEIVLNNSGLTTFSK